MTTKSFIAHYGQGFFNRPEGIKATRLIFCGEGAWCHQRFGWHWPGDARGAQWTNLYWNFVFESFREADRSWEWGDFYSDMLG